MDYKEYFNMLRKDPAYQAAYEDLRPNFTVGTAVMRARIEKNISQAELANRVGTKQSNISKLESGLANPTLEFLKKVFIELDLGIQVISLADPSQTYFWSHRWQKGEQSSPKDRSKGHASDFNSISDMLKDLNSGQRK